MQRYYILYYVYFFYFFYKIKSFLLGKWVLCFSFILFFICSNIFHLIAFYCFLPQHETRQCDHLIAFRIHINTLMYCYVLLCLWQAAYYTLSLAGPNRLLYMVQTEAKEAIIWPLFGLWLPWQLLAPCDHIAGVPMVDRGSPLPVNHPDAAAAIAHSI